MEPKNPEENMKPEILAIGLNIPEKKIYCSLVGGGFTIAHSRQLPKTTATTQVVVQRGALLTRHKVGTKLLLMLVHSIILTRTV